jgi:hypothetical protein
MTQARHYAAISPANTLITINVGLYAVKLVCAYIQRRHPRTVDAEYDPQICFDYDAINRVPGLSRELMDFVRSERRMERIAFERLPRASNRFFCDGLSR